MIQLLLLVSLAGASSNQTTALNQSMPCVWPNRCAQQVLQVAQVQTCVLPNRCSSSGTRAI